MVKGVDVSNRVGTGKMWVWPWGGGRGHGEVEQPPAQGTSARSQVLLCSHGTSTASTWLRGELVRARDAVMFWFSITWSPAETSVHHTGCHPASSEGQRYRKWWALPVWPMESRPSDPAGEATGPAHLAGLCPGDLLGAAPEQPPGSGL